MDNPFMSRAIQLSVENVLSGRGGPFGAVIVRDSRIVAEGVNRVTSTNDPTACRSCRHSGGLRQAGLFRVERLRTPMCLGASYWARLARIYFGAFAADASRIGFDDSAIYHEFARPHSERSVPMAQMMREQALTAFRAWNEKTDKIPY